MTAMSYKVVDRPWSPGDPAALEADLGALGQAGWRLLAAHPDGSRERTRWIFGQAAGAAAASYKVVDYPWSPNDPTVAESDLDALGALGWQLVLACPDRRRERTRWILSQ